VACRFLVDWSTLHNEINHTYDIGNKIAPTSHYQHRLLNSLLDVYRKHVNLQVATNTIDLSPQHGSFVIPEVPVTLDFMINQNLVDLLQFLSRKFNIACAKVLESPLALG